MVGVKERQRSRLIGVAGVGVPWSAVLLLRNNTAAYTEGRKRERNQICVASTRKINPISEGLFH